MEKRHAPKGAKNRVSLYQIAVYVTSIEFGLFIAGLCFFVLAMGALK